MKFHYSLVLILAFSCKSNSTFDDRSINENQTALGTKYFIWADADRIDPTYGNQRIINVQVWYPAVMDSSNQMAAYYSQIEVASKTIDNWSKENVELVQGVKTNVFIDASIRHQKDKYPLVIFSPSLGGNMNQYSHYAQELASSGYIVAGINHAYESEFVLNKAKEVIPANLFFHDSLKQLSIPDEITADEYRSVMGIRQKILGEDVVFALDQLLDSNESIFHDQIDQSSIGVWGHSIGGAAAVYASILDDRVTAVLNLDGTPPSIALENGIDVPFMFIEDLTDYENHVGYQKLHKRRNDFCEKNRSVSSRILFGNTNHNSFLDINYHFAESKENKERFGRILNVTAGYMIGFFDTHLKNQPVSLEPTKSDSLEVWVFNKD